MSELLGDPNREPSEQELAERTISILLEDSLGGVQPPDLRSRIMSRLERLAQEELSTGERGPRAFSQLEYEAAVAAAAQDVRDGYAVVVPPPIETPVELDEPNLNVWIHRGIGLIAALAAAVIGVIFVPGLFRKEEVAKPSSNEVAVIVPNQAHENANVAPSTTDQPKETLPSSGLVENTPTSKVEPLEPITTDRNIASTEGEMARRPRGGHSVDALADADIVSLIDSQWQHLWDRLDVAVSHELKQEAWLDRAAIALVGRPATSSEKERFRSSNSPTKAADFVDEWIDSSGTNEFAKHWSGVLAEYYLGKDIVVGQEITPGQLDFMEWLEQRISEDAFVGDLEREMVDFRNLASSEESIRDVRPAYWLMETIERSEAAHRDSEDHLTPLRNRLELREAGLVGASRQVMRIGGNTWMVCTQCHLEGEATASLPALMSMDGPQSKRGSDNFWNVSGNLSGISTEYRGLARSLKIDPKQEFFFDDNDGRVKLAVAAAPTMSPAASNFKSLSDWMQSSTEPRQALVELAWGQIFKQPLVPAFGLNDQEGASERSDLKDLLASQVQVKRSSLKGLVRWLVLSKPFRLEGVRVDTQWYLKANESQIAQLQRQFRLMSAFPSTDQFIVESGRLDPSHVAHWVDKQKSFQKNSALAQGAVNRPKANEPKSSKLEYNEDQVRYFISVANPYGQLHSMAERISSSSMSWPMLVEHAFLATDARFPNKAERNGALKLLEAANKDRQKAFVMLVSGRLGSW